MTLRHFLRALAISFVVALRATASLADGTDPRPSSDATEARDDGAFVQGEKTVETRLLAPCCWNGTLDVHESDLAHELRREIRGRLRRGESVDAVEASMIERYGERVRATPANEHVGLLLGAGALGVVLMAFVLLRRAAAGMRPDPTAGTFVAVEARDEWDERLDEALERRRERMHG